jgi:hypothetical protein
VVSKVTRVAKKCVQLTSLDSPVNETVHVIWRTR